MNPAIDYVDCCDDWVVASHCLIVSSGIDTDPRSRHLVDDAHALGLPSVTRIQVEEIYHLEGDLANHELSLIAEKLLVDSVVQTYRWRNSADDPGVIIETTPRPGVTDTVAAELVEAAAMLAITGLHRAATGRRFTIEGISDEVHLETLAKRLLVNPVVERYGFGPLDAIYPSDEVPDLLVAEIPLRGLDDLALSELSARRGLSLDLTEMQAIRDYFVEVGREPSDAEVEMLAQTWSEHCVHKTFRARIETGNGVVDGLLNSYIRAATETINPPWIRSAFVDDAGIIEFDDEFDVSYKVETHNHPSAIEPFGGANTGVGGVVRDVLGVSARPIAVTDILCFGLPDMPPEELPPGVLHPRRIRSGVVAGVGDYGNKIGVPNVAGAVVYHRDYTTNPLVFAGCVGIAPKGSHPVGANPGDRIVVIGGAVGRDGIGGATFSSRTTAAETIDDAGSSVQIGNPIVEKGLIEVVTRARDAGLYTAITDCGAGGLSSSVGEMAEEIGASVDLATVPLKYAGLQPWEIWLSEAQERMVMAVPDSAALKDLCEIYEIGFADIGEFTGDGRLSVRHGDLNTIDLDCAFLHDGIPQRTMRAELPDTSRAVRRAIDVDPQEALFRLLAHPTIASSESIVRTYDHEVMGATTVRPYGGIEADGPSDGTVIRPIGTHGDKGIVLGIGVNALFGRLDAYRMARSVIDEAVRNVVAAGANPDRIAILDNFSWGDPTRPDNLGTLVEAARGCHDGALSFLSPFISGKDSLYNEFVAADGSRRPIPPTLVISALAMIDDVHDAVTSDLKRVGDHLFLVGETRNELGGSHLDDVLGEDFGGAVPAPVDGALDQYRRLHAAMSEGLIAACHDLSEGGLGVAAAEMCVGGRLGMRLRVTGDAIVELFSESNARFLVEVHPDQLERFNSAGLVTQNLGVVAAEQRLIIDGEKWLVDIGVEQILEALR